jgi:hypothetical protein
MSGFAPWAVVRHEQTFMPSRSSRVLVFATRAVALHALMFAAVRRSRLSLSRHEPEGRDRSLGRIDAEPRGRWCV